MIDRRSFLKDMVAGMAITSAVRQWPFRVYSFPPEVKTVPLTLHEGYSWWDSYEIKKGSLLLTEHWVKNKDGVFLNGKLTSYENFPFAKMNFSQPIRFETGIQGPKGYRLSSFQKDDFGSVNLHEVRENIK